MFKLTNERRLYEADPKFDTQVPGARRQATVDHKAMSQRLQGLFLLFLICSTVVEPRAR